MSKRKAFKKPASTQKPPEKSLQIDSRQLQLTKFTSPLPPPETLKDYDMVLPGAAERILSMAEQQARHRQNLEEIAVKSGSRDSLLGIICGLIIGLVSITGSVICILSGQPLGGGALGVTGLGGLVGVFVYGTRERRKEREAKRNSVQLLQNSSSSKA
ncbi:MAG: DUF2335 domain-containing protein [Deltaproteobacteria bacterium]|nr:DUF2335 domain-containing protein [Deltaproteobacteria bacterium]